MDNGGTAAAMAAAAAAAIRDGGRRDASAVAAATNAPTTRAADGAVAGSARPQHVLRAGMERGRGYRRQWSGAASPPRPRRRCRRPRGYPSRRDAAIHGATGAHREGRGGGGAERGEPNRKKRRPPSVRPHRSARGGRDIAAAAQAGRVCRRQRGSLGWPAPPLPRRTRQGRATSPPPRPTAAVAGGGAHSGGGGHGTTRTRRAARTPPPPLLARHGQPRRPATARRRCPP